MKRIFKIGIFCALMLTLTFIYCACSCEHECDNWQTVVASTCQSGGTDIGVCKKCGEATVRNTDIGEHTYVQTIIREATCSERGEKKFDCSVCGDSYTAEYIKLNAHDYVETVITPATCVSAGTRLYVCSECESSYTEEYSDSEAHTYVESVLVRATCISEGTRKFVCSGCEASYTEQYSISEYEPSELYNAAKGSVVEIKCYDRLGKSLMLGTGFVYSDDGKIVTNYHVIRGAYTVKIIIGNSTYSAKSILAYDEKVDIAVLKINASGLTPLYICSEPVAVGETVYAIGSSKGLTDTFSKGMISYAGREIEGVSYIQHTVASSTGNSGGPLLNKYCEVIGINTMSASDSQNLNFAIFATEISKLSFDNPLTPAELYAQKTDPAEQLVNFIIAEGQYYEADKQYTVSLGRSFSADYTTAFQLFLTYDTTNKSIQLTNYVAKQGMQFMVMIYIPSEGQGYEWGYVDELDNMIFGDINAAAFGVESVLTYNQSNVDSQEARETILGISQGAICVGLMNFETAMQRAVVRVNASDIGFTSFSDSIN